MLAYIKGSLEEKATNYVVIEVGGIGYKIFMSETAIERLGINAELLEFYGYSREQVPMLYNAVDCGLLTSFTEGSPQFVKEAVACGCPVVSTDVGDAAEVVNRVENSYITTYEVEDVVNKVRLALKKGHLNQTNLDAKYIEKNNEDKNLLYKIFEFVESNFDKNCSLKFLSKKTGFSYPYLSRYFKNNVGISFNSYVNQYRINNACYILNNSNCSILECALDSGYTSLRSFNRNFKSITGITPKEYRESMLG